jgi:hypothetical protein
VNLVIPRIKEKPKRYRVYSITKEEWQDAQLANVWPLH